MRVLVTGATGCLGGALARRLASQRVDVIGSGRNATAGARLTEDGVRFAPADLSDKAAVDAITAGCDAVVHSGGLAAPWGPARAFAAANVEGTRNAVEAALRNNVGRFVFISTPSVYFDFRNRLNITEDAPLPKRPVNAYAASKLAGEAIVRDAMQRGLPAVIVRPRAIIGPGDTTILPRLMRVAERGRILLIDGGRALVDMTYVENVVDALVAIVAAPGIVEGRTYNISNGEPSSVASLFGRIAEALQLRVRLITVPFGMAYAAATALEAIAGLLPSRPEPMLTRYTVGVLGRSQTLSIEAARRDFGYAPRVPLAEGIQRAALWQRAAHA